MSEKLKDLKNKRLKAECELRAINKEIEAIEKEILDANVERYKGKWYFKSISQYDEDDQEYKSHEVVYIRDVLKDGSNVYFHVSIITVDAHWKREVFNFEQDDNFSLSELDGYCEMFNYVLRDMDDAIEDLFDCLIKIRPSLKYKLKNILKEENK